MPAKKRPVRAVAASKHSLTPPDKAAMERAVADFLRAAGHDPTKSDELARTPARVAAAWNESFLDGYTRDAAGILGDQFPEAGGEPVVLRDIQFHSMCPHHLLPFTGVAHIAFVPIGKSVGFSRIVQLLDCFAHRLTLQETIGREICKSLVDVLGARAAACALETTQACVTLRGVRRTGTRIRTEATAGNLRLRAALAASIRIP